MGKKKDKKVPPVATRFDPFASPRGRGWAYVAVFLISFALRVASSGPHFFASYDPGHRNFEFYDSNYQALLTATIVKPFDLWQPSSKPLGNFERCRGGSC